MQKELTGSQQKIIAALRLTRDELLPLEKKAATVRGRRAMFVVKAVKSGLSTRLIGEEAGMSSSAVSQIMQRRKAKEDRGEREQ